MTVVPCPNPDDRPLNETVSADLAGGTKLTAEFEPEQRTTTIRLPILAISKFADMTYEVRADGERIFGPSTIPPTDIDDLQVTFIPSHSFSQKLEVIVKNLSSTTRTVIVQPVGWEVT